MSFPVILGIALALAMDAFAVSVGLGLSLSPATRGQTIRLAASFGLFQFFMPIVGWAAGERIIGYIKGYDHWVAFALLFGVAGHMIFGSFRSPKETGPKKSDPTKGLSLLVLSVATSLDALAIGLSLAALHAAIVFPAAIIGLVAFGLTIAGMKLGPLFGRAVGKRAELAGGIVLIIIGIKILADHL
jgi:putative Mn2+ efflux pump MntP